MGNKKENEKKAIEKDKIDTLSILDEEDSNDGKEQTLLLAAKEGELNIIKWLAESGMEVAKSKEAVVLAMENNRSRVLEFLIKNGADMNIRTEFTTVMSFFVLKSDIEMVRYLIGKGYDIYNEDVTEHYSSLSVAASKGELEIFKYLFEETGKNDKKCHKIKLFCGIYYGTVDIVKYVIDNMDVDDEKYVKRIMETYCLGNETNGEKTIYLMDSGILAE